MWVLLMESPYNKPWTSVENNSAVGQMSLVVNHYTTEMTTDTMKGCYIVSERMEEKIHNRFSLKPIYLNPFASPWSSPSFVHHQFSLCVFWQHRNSCCEVRKEPRHPRKANYAILPCCSQHSVAVMRLSDLWVSYTLKKVYGLGGARLR